MSPLFFYSASKAASDAPEWQIATPQAPLSVIIFHGFKDEKVPYSGGAVGGESSKREYASVSEAVEFWIEHNRCRDSGRRQTRFDGAVEITTWQDCADEVEVQLHAFRDVGHHWSAIVTTDHHGTQASYDAAEVIWDFFKKFHKTPSTLGAVFNLKPED